MLQCTTHSGVAMRRHGARLRGTSAVGNSSGLPRRSWFVGARLLALSAATSACAVGACSETPSEAVASGRVLWRVAGSAYGIPAYDANTVYFTARRGDVVAIDRMSHTVRWTAVTDSLGERVGPNVLVVGNSVVVADRQVYGFNRVTGARIWRSSVEAPGYAPGTTQMSTDGVRVFTGSPAGITYAFDGATGAVLWSQVLGNDGNTAAMSPGTDGDLVVVGIRRFGNPITGGIAALDARTGVVRWRREFSPSRPGQDAGSLGGAVFAGNLVVVTADDGRVYGLARADGAVRWVGAPRPENVAAGGDTRPLALAGQRDNQVVVAGSTTGTLTAFDAVSGTVRWEASADRGSAYAPLAADASQVYATHLGGQLAAFDVATGRVRWIAGDTDAAGEFTPSPALADDVLYVGGLNGFYALRAR